MSTVAHRFRNRAEAGRLLAERLREYAGRDDVVVLALPRGGVPVAFEVARALEQNRSELRAKLANAIDEEGEDLAEFLKSSAMRYFARHFERKPETVRYRVAPRIDRGFPRTAIESRIDLDR